MAGTKQASEFPNPVDVAQTSLSEDNTRPSFIWLCQYSREQMRTLEQRAKPGDVEPWRINNVRSVIIENEMEPGDTVVFWRTVDKVKGKRSEKSRGGIVGWGRINDGEYFDGRLIKIHITHWFPNEPVQRDKVIEALAIASSSPTDPKKIPQNLKLFPGQTALRQLVGTEYQVFKRYINKRGSMLGEETSNPDFEIATSSHGDAPTANDDLGRRPFARGLVDQIKSMMADGDVNDGYAVHIHAPWGAGKTSFWRLMKERFESTRTLEINQVDGVTNEALGKDDERKEVEFPEEPPWICAEFNAWRHQHRRPPWWAIIQEMIKGLQAKQPGSGKPVILDQGSRKEINRLNWLWKAQYEWLPIILGSLILFSILFFGGVFNAGSFEGLGDVFKALSSIVTAVLGVFAFTRLASFGSQRDVDFHFQISKDPLANVTKLFKDILDASSQNVCVFIDDLDRCSPEYVVEVLEGIQTSFRHHRLCYVIAADKDWIRTSFHDHFSRMADNVGSEGQPLGYLFLEKIFQVSTPLPGVSNEKRMKFLEGLLEDEKNILKTTEYQDDENAELPLETESEATEESSFDEAKFQAALKKIIDSGLILTPEVRLMFLEEDDSEEMRAALVAAVGRRSESDDKRTHLLRSFSDILPTNPRALKRTLNAFSLRHFISIVEGSDVPLGKLARWTILEQQYPIIADLLSSNPSFLKSFKYKLPEEDFPKDKEFLLKNTDIQSVMFRKISGEDAEQNEELGLTVDDIHTIIGGAKKLSGIENTLSEVQFKKKS